MKKRKGVHQTTMNTKKPSITEPIVEKEETLNLEELKEAHEKVVEEKEQQVFTHDQLLEALYWIWDLFERASMTMVLIKDTGDSAYHDRPLKGDAIYVAARRLEWDSGARGVIDSLAQYVHATDDQVTFKANNDVPVVVYILPDDYCLTSADVKLYEHENFKFPNPYERFKEVYNI